MPQREAARTVIRRLQECGYEAFLVGGCVRDLALGREPKDYDVCTNARPQDVGDIFFQTLDVGAAFGVVIVMLDGQQIEVATYRADGQYSDGRHPDTVTYSKTAKEDVQRRDFTINGLLLTTPMDRPVAYIGKDDWDMFNGDAIVDFVDGREDLDNRLIRCIGDPVARFTEDPLRMLRAVRFAAQLGFDIEANTMAAIVRQRANLPLVSRERVAMELFKMVTAPYPVKGLAPLFSTGLARYAFFQPAFTESLKLGFTLERFAQCPTTDPLLGLAMLLVDANLDFPDGAAFQVLRCLKLANEQTLAISGALKIIHIRRLFSAAQGMPADLKRAARLRGCGLALSLFEQDGLIGKSLHSPEEVAMVLRNFRSLTPEEINQIGAFKQFDRKKHEQQGLGLGLVLVQKLAALSHAEVAFKSQPGEGTEVRIAFPQAS